MATKKKKVAAPRSLQSRLSEIQGEAEKQLRAGLDRTLEMLPPEPRKAVKRFSADLDKAQRDLRKRAENAVKDARKQAERFASDMQKRVEKAVAPVTSKLAVASRSDLDALRKRVDHLEKKIEAQSHTHHAPVPHASAA